MRLFLALTASLLWSTALSAEQTAHPKPVPPVSTNITEGNTNKSPPLSVFLSNSPSKEAAWESYEFLILRTVYLTGNIDDGNIDKLIRDISILNGLDQEKPIKIKINSPGGNVYAGLRLHSVLNEITAPIHTVCDGMAMSMAAVILVLGDHRIANQGCHYMIHPPSSMGSDGVSTPTSYVQKTDHLLGIQDILIRILSENSGLSEADIRSMFEFETFYTAEELVELGFADEAVTPTAREKPGSRKIPEHLVPKTRIIRHLTEELNQ